MSSHKLQSAVELIVWKPQPNRNNKKRVGRGEGEGGGGGRMEGDTIWDPIINCEEGKSASCCNISSAPWRLSWTESPKIQFHRRFFSSFFSRSSKGGSILGGVYIPRLTAPLASKFSTALDRAIEPPARETRMLGLGGAERPIAVTTIRLSEISRHLHYRAWTRNERKQNTK